MLRIAAVALAASLSLAGTGLAQTQTHNDTVYDSISPPDLLGIVQGLGYASVTSLDPTSFEVTTGTGFVFQVYALTCDEVRKGAVVTRCFGVEISTSWTVDAVEVAGLTAAANEYTAAYSLLKAFVDEAGALNAQRYGFLDGGVTRAHIENEIKSFVDAVDYMLNDIEASTGLDFTRPY